MKICTYCKAQYDDSEVICRTCGNKLVDAGANQGYAPTGYDQAPQNPQPQYQPQPYQQAPQQPYQAPVTPPAKKGGIQWWHILLIVLAVLIIGGLIAGIVAVGVIGNSDAPVEDVYEEVENVDDDEDDEIVTSDAVDTDDEEEVVDETTTEAPVEYTVGEFVDGIYSNEWANMWIDFTGWTEGSAEDYSVYTADGKTDCWLVALDYDSMTQVVILAEPLYGLNNAYTETEYLDIVLSQVTPVYDSYDLEYTVFDYYSEEYAGKTYECADIEISSTSSYIEYKTVKIDNYMVSFIISNNAGEWGSFYMPYIYEY